MDICFHRHHTVLYIRFQLRFLRRGNLDQDRTMRGYAGRVRARYIPQGPVFPQVDNGPSGTLANPQIGPIHRDFMLLLPSVDECHHPTVPRRSDLASPHFTL